MRQTARVHCGDALELLQGLEDDCVDAVVTDPPSGIGFMGNAWDSDKGGRNAWIAWLADIMREALRVTKPGGHALVWALPRTQHWTATAVEDAGWQVRDVLMHVFGSGFPKSTSVPIGIDKKLGAMGHRGKAHHGHATGHVANGRENLNAPQSMPAHDGITPEAKQWAGWGTALKPSHEAWILARKPLAGTVAATVLEHGTGALNIDGCRVSAAASELQALARWNAKGHNGWKNSSGGANAAAIRKEEGRAPLGRWPPHLLLTHAAACGETCADGCPVAEMDAQSGVSASGVAVKRNGVKNDNPISFSGPLPPGTLDVGYGDTGGASRFFPVFRYVAKPSTAEKSAGLDGRNTHATVKPLQLMRWLCRLITPPGGLVLDPFAGSGTTGAAAMAEGFSFVGAEMRPEQAAAARQRIEHALAGLEVKQSGAETPEPAAKAGQLGLW